MLFEVAMVSFFPMPSLPEYNEYMSQTKFCYIVKYVFNKYLLTSRHTIIYKLDLEAH